MRTLTLCVVIAISGAVAGGLFGYSVWGAIYGDENPKQFEPITVEEKLESHLHTLNGHWKMMRDMDRRLDEMERLRGRMERVEDAVIELRETTKQG